MATPQMRLGGAFMALAVTLGLMYVADTLVSGIGGNILVTPRMLCVCLAAMLFGAFASTSREASQPKAQVVALSLSVVLIAVGMLAPRIPLYALNNSWLVLYGLGLAACALVLRRTAAR